MLVFEEYPEKTSRNKGENQQQTQPPACVIPWVPEVFSRLRRGASFRRSQADTCSAEGQRHERRSRIDPSQIGKRG